MSFALPGLGQLYAGRTRRGLLIAGPIAFLLGFALAAATIGTRDLLAAALRPEILGALLLLVVVLVPYHAAAIVDAYRIAGGTSLHGRPMSPAALFVTLLVATTVIVYAGLGYVVARGSQTLDTVFVPGGPDDAWGIPAPGFGSPSPSTPGDSPAPGSPTATATARPTRTPALTPRPQPEWVTAGRLNLLLIGSDAGPGRRSLRTDTMIILSVEVATGRAALFGIPRNVVNAPLPPESAGAFPDGRFPDMLSGLYVHAMANPASFPGGEARGFRATTGAIQELVGVPLHGTAVVNLTGFVRLVDALGGLWVDVPARLVDPTYPLEDASGEMALDIRAGCQRLDGRMALAYARSRRQDSDYGRMARQQHVLVALQRQVDPIALLPRLPELFDVAEDNVWTTIDRSEFGAIADLAARVDPDRIATRLFVPPRYPAHLDGAAIERIRGVVRSAFDGPMETATPSPSSSPSCP